MQGGEFVFQRGRLLGHEVAPLVKPGADAAPVAAAGEATGKDAPATRGVGSRSRHVGPGAQGVARPRAPLGPAQARTSG